MSEKMDYVIFASAWSSYGIESLRDGLEPAIVRVISDGATPVIFKGTPAPRTDLSRCTLHRALGWTNIDCSFSAGEALAEQQPYDEFIDEIAQNYRGVVVVDPKSLLCSGGYCRTELAGMAVYRDRYHLNDVAARELGKVFLGREANFLTVLNAPIPP